MRYDHQLLAALRRFGADPAVAGTAKGLSLAGEHGAVWIAAGLAGAGADRVRRRAWLRATALVAGSHLASIGVKRVVRRPRPQLPSAEPLVRTSGRHSFPSSHATSSAAAAIAFGALMARGPLARAVPVVPSVAAAVCLSRLVVGVHYPTDVACGALLGGAMARIGRGWTLGTLPDVPPGPPVPPVPPVPPMPSMSPLPHIPHIPPLPPSLAGVGHD